METDPLNQLTVFYESKGYIGKEAVEKAEAELDKRRKERALELSAGQSHCLLSFVIASVSAHCSVKSYSFNIYDSYDD
jgi:hypothetical protein